MSMPKPLLLALLACGLSACSLAPLQPTTALQPVLRTGQAANRVEEWNQLARHHLERGQVNLAMGAYAQSLALDAGQLEARNAVAVIEAQKGHLPQARQALLALTRDYPGEAMPHTNLGYVYYLEGDFAAARRTLQRAMALGGGTKAFQNLQMTENAERLAAVTPPELDMNAPAEPVAVAALAAAPVPLTRLAVASAASIAVASPRDQAFVTTLADAAPVPAATAPAARAPQPSIQEPAALNARIELVQLAPSIFELKQLRTADEREDSAAQATAQVAAQAAALLPAPVAATVLAQVAQAQPPRAAPAQAARPAAALMQASLPPAALAPAPLASAPASAALTHASVPPAGAAPAVIASAVLTAATNRAVPAPAPRAPARSPRVRLEIANGNGIEGMARRFRAALGDLGIAVDRLTNEKPYRQALTTIQYSPGFEKQAASLQQALQGKAQLASHPSLGSDMRLVLGKDAAQGLAGASDAAGEAASAALMASTPAPNRRRN